MDNNEIEKNQTCKQVIVIKVGYARDIGNDWPYFIISRKYW